MCLFVTKGGSCTNLSVCEEDAFMVEGIPLIYYPPRPLEAAYESKVHGGGCSTPPTTDLIPTSPPAAGKCPLV